MRTLTNLHMVKCRADVPPFLAVSGLTHAICEVGVRYGYNFRQMLSSRPEMAVAVDHWQRTADPAEQDTDLSQKQLDAIYLDVCREYLYRPNVKIIRAKSLDAASRFSRGFFDYVYLDADHTEDGCFRDMAAWFPLVRQGGVLAGHDYVNATAKNETSFGVIAAVQRFRAEKKIPDAWFHATGEGYCSWFIYNGFGE